MVFRATSFFAVFRLRFPPFLAASFGDTGVGKITRPRGDQPEEVKQLHLLVELFRSASPLWPLVASGRQESREHGQKSRGKREKIGKKSWKMGVIKSLEAKQAKTPLVQTRPFRFGTGSWNSFCNPLDHC